ncbi:substrate-binding periplasmic protein [Roseibium sp.]|uniref:substrate-binding periplasmic protein n=1 Tax=Roseibium sp. TaxID=1936156 RepID=UPI003BA854CF
MLRLRLAKLACHFFFMLLMLNASAFAQTLTFTADEWCPVNCEPGSERPGYMVEIAEAILKPEGYEINYVTLNWSRALIYTRSGRFNAVFGALKGDAPDFVFPTSPQGMTAVGLFVRQDSNWLYADSSSLANQRIGLIRDYAYGDELEKLIQQYAKPNYSGGDKPLELNMRQMIAGRLDIVVEDVNTFRHSAKELGLDREFKLAKTFSEEEIFVAFSPDAPSSQELADLLGKGMHRLRQTGELAKILARYGLSDWAISKPASEDKIGN